MSKKGKLKLTKTMLEKSIIDCNESIRDLMEPLFNFENAVPDKRYKFESIFTSTKTKATITFYKTHRGDRRISIQKLKQHAEIGDIVELTLKNNTIHIEIKRS